MKGVYQDAVQVDSTACLGKSESGGILVEVAFELFHGEGINFLAGLIFQVLWNKGSMEVFI